ncbi:MAG: sigma-70 family RNA polymerase sigma factor [Acidimicrobiales bacterium]
MRSVDVEEMWTELVRRVQSGDERAFAVLWRRHQPSLLRYLEIVAGPNAAEDVAADTWISLVRALPRFRGTESGFKALLFTTARSRLVDAARRAQSRPQVVRPLDDVDGPAAGEGPGAELERAEATRAALAMIARLPAAQAEVVALRIIGGLDHAEVAAVVGKSQGAVRVASSRGLAALAEMVRGAGGGDAAVTDPSSLTFR